MIVISLGGSQIIHDNAINLKFLQRFREILRENRKYSFVVVCGGGNVARMYISGLKADGKSNKFQSFAGISATRTNARFMSYLFGIEHLKGIPHTMKDVQSWLKKERIIFCGALEYHPEQTSDSTSAQIAEALDAEFINMTNVDGLYNKNPLEHKNARLISDIGWKEFDEIASRMGFSPGQHFVLDQKAAKIIREKKIRTYILGQDLKNLENVLKGKSFLGTRIYG